MTAKKTTEIDRLLNRIRRDNDDRWDAINSLADIATPESDLALLRLLEHRSSRVREAVLTRLSERENWLVRLACRASLSDNAACVRITAASELTEQGTSLDRNRLQIALAQDPDWLVRAYAADSLASIPGKDVQTALREALRNDDEPIVRRDAASALAAKGDPKIISTLENALLHERAEQTRVGLLGGLYALGQRERLAPLLELFQSDDSRVRYAVLHSATDLACSEDIPRVIAAIQGLLENEQNPGLRIDAERTLKDLITENGKNNP